MSIRAITRIVASSARHGDGRQRERRSRASLSRVTEHPGTGIDDLWTCPRCGHRFVTANIWHSCTRIDLDEAFARSIPSVREVFDRYVELIARCGPVTVIAQRTRIVVMARVRFAGALVRRDRLVANFALTRRLDDPRFAVETYSRGWIGASLRAAHGGGPRCLGAARVALRVLPGPGHAGRAASASGGRPSGRAPTDPTARNECALERK